MQYRELGVSGLNVSGICMGCMGFGEAGNGQHTWTIDEEHSREIIRRGLELGVNFFDTAIGYQSGTVRCGIMQGVTRWLWLRNSFPAHRKKSRQALPGSSISSG